MGCVSAQAGRTLARVWLYGAQQLGYAAPVSVSPPVTMATLPRRSGISKGSSLSDMGAFVCDELAAPENAVSRRATRVAISSSNLSTAQVIAGK